MRKGFTKIAIVLDRSGSMESVRSATIEGLNQFINEQKKLPGACDLRIVQFDNEYETVYDGSVHNAPTFSYENYKPRGGTALYDAIGRTVDTLGTGLAWMGESDRPDKVLVAIITDGQENASHDYTGQRIGTMVSHQQRKYSWEFVFIGANQDAILSASRINIPLRSAIYYDHSYLGTVNASNALNSYTTSFRNSSGSTDMLKFTEEQRALAANGTVPPQTHSTTDANTQ